MRFRTWWLLLLVLLGVAAPAAAQREAVTPAPGSPERRELMDALRRAVRDDLVKPVIFEVTHLKAQGDYAFFSGVVRNPDGTPFDYSGTPYQEAIDGGTFDDWIYAIFGRIGGRWVCLDYGIGATDVGWLWYLTRYDAPRGIYPEHGGEHDHH